MNTQKMIYWHDGLFLKPHHFIYLNKNTSDSIKRLYNHLICYDWGMVDIELNQEKFSEKEISLKNGTFYFKDGAYVNYPENAAVIARSFDSVLHEERSIKIYIGIKKLTDHETNVTEIDTISSLQHVKTRYVCNRDEITSVGNLFQNNDFAQMNYLEYVIQFFWEDELPSLTDYELLPLTELENKGGEIKVSQSFIPPVLNIFKNKLLETIVNDIRDNILSHVNQLEEYKTPLSASSKDMSVTKNLVALQALAPAVPLIDSLQQKGIIHPWEMYNIYLQLVASLSIFTDRVNVLGKLKDGTQLLPEYDHDNLIHCFSMARQLIYELMDDIIIGPEYILPFKKSNSIYILEISQSIISSQYTYFLSIKNSDIANINDKINFMKISTAENIDTIVKRSLPGVTFKLQDIPPVGLPNREDITYLELQSDKEYWLNIKKFLNIAIYWDQIDDEVDIKLIVVNK